MPGEYLQLHLSSRYLRAGLSSAPFVRESAWQLSQTFVHTCIASGPQSRSRQRSRGLKEVVIAGVNDRKTQLSPKKIRGILRSFHLQLAVSAGSPFSKLQNYLRNCD